MAVTVNLQGVLTICIHVGFGRGDHASLGSIKGHLKVIARSKFRKFKKKNKQAKPYCPLLDGRNV